MGLNVIKVENHTQSSNESWTERVESANKAQTKGRTKHEQSKAQKALLVTS